MMSEYLKPLPTLNKENSPFWDGCRQHKLRMQQCDDCEHIRFPINSVCPKCLSANFKWKDLSGRATVFSYIVFHQVYNKAFANDVPYNVALVQLEEGPRMYSNVVGTDNDAVKVGQKLIVTFDPVTPEITIPRFRMSE
jgi:uncharacterized OB-fold protein